MAYGVKFRLDFEDHEGNGKRLDILKDGYTGEILPLVGSADPVKIKWDGDDDLGLGFLTEEGDWILKCRVNSIPYKGDLPLATPTHWMPLPEPPPEEEAL